MRAKIFNYDFKGLTSRSSTTKAIPFLILMVLPLDLQLWLPINLTDKVGPNPRLEKGALLFTTTSSTLGYGYLFANPLVNPLASWAWDVSQYPDASTQIPFLKSHDDFALRVGFLISGTGSHIKIPGDLTEKMENRNISLSYVISYVPVLRLPQGERCGESPYSNHII